ncbi:MAG: SPOR domain-containing protein [Nitrosomonadales bacterium]
MKKVLWVLIAVNVIFFAVMKSGIFNGSPDAQVLTAIHAEKITLAASSAPVAAVSSVSEPVAAAVLTPVSAPVVASVATRSCFEWGEFTGAEFDRASAALKKLSLGDKLSQREVDRVIGFWVYIAPQKDKGAVTQKLAQLKARGVTDFFVVQEAGEWQNAISLGIFKTREAAESFMEGLRKKEVTSAKMGERSSKIKSVVFVFDGLDVKVSEKLSALQKEFAVSELKSVSCH